MLAMDLKLRDSSGAWAERPCFVFRGGGACVPLLYGLHEDYHRPSDDFGKINLTGMVRITDMVTDLVHQLATGPQRPTFIDASGSAEVRMQKPKQAKMGIMVDAQSEQVVIQSVNRGGAADKAGIMPLDIVVKLGEFDIGNLQSLNAALRQI